MTLDFICNVHKENYRRTDTCYLCLEEMEIRIKQLEAVLKKATQLINRQIDHGCTYSYGFVLKDLLNEIKALEGKDA